MQETVIYLPEGQKSRLQTQEQFCALFVGAKVVYFSMECVLQHLLRLQIHICLAPTMRPLGIYSPVVLIIYVQNDACTRFFIEVLFYI
jgi:hypothetical protein